MTLIRVRTEEGHYTIKRVPKLPKRGNANWLYVIIDTKIEEFYRWDTLKSVWETITIGGGGGGTMATTSFTPYLTLESTDGQAAVEELKDELDAAIIGVGTGVPIGGTPGQVLSKIDGTDFNLEWADPNGELNNQKGVFNGVFDVSGGVNNFYNDYDDAPVLNLSISASPVLGSISTVRIAGGKVGTIPNNWSLTGDNITSLASKWNELTILYVASNDIRIVNRVYDIIDTEAPTIPTNLVSSNISASSFDLDWTASTDNIGIFEYRIYLDGVFNKTSSVNSTTVTGLTGATDYDVTVSAVDFAGNESAQSTVLLVTTLAVSNDTPATILANLHLWFDGGDASTMTLDGSNKIQDYTDKELGLTLTSFGATQLFDTDKIVFDNLGLLSSTTPSAVLVPSVDFHGFFIFKNLPVEDGNDMLTNRLNSTNRFQISMKDGDLSVGTYNGGFNNKSVAFSDATSYHKLEFKNVSGVITAYLDDILMTGTGSQFTSGVDGFHLGGVQDNLTLLNDFEFKDFFVNAGEMTTQERTDILNYINLKYSL